MVNTTAGRDELVGRVIDAQWCLRRAFARHGSAAPLLDLNLTMQQTKALLVLSIHDNAMPGQALARHLGVSLATLTGIVDRLVSQGLVTRREDAEDRRVRLVELTEHGRSLVEGVRDAGLEHMRRLLSRLDDETLAAFELVLRRLRDAAEEEAAELGGGPGGCCG
ncbi:MAG TPA: MarR family transcriptional regulator [Rugosimonospora sp.]|nr:MarR family transcriptional regulator [Rugosimonospora sp.]